MVRTPVRCTNEDFLRIRVSIQEAQIVLEKEMAECNQLGGKLLASQCRVDRDRDRLEALYLELRDSV